MILSGRIFKEVVKFTPWSLRCCSTAFNYANWPDKTNWSHIELLEALRSIGSDEQPLFPKGIHIDPNLSSTDASDIAVYTASKRYGVAAAVSLIEKYPDTFSFRDPPKHMNSVTDKGITYLKSSIEIDDAETFFNAYKILIDSGKRVSPRILFRMTERACLFDLSGTQKIYAQNDENTNTKAVSSFGQVILEHFKESPNSFVNEGYFFGLLWTLQSECAQKFFEENTLFEGVLYSDLYYLYALKNFPAWYKSPDMIAAQCDSVIDLYTKRKIVPSDDVMNQILILMCYQGNKAFKDFLDEMNNMKIPLSLESFRCIHSTLGKDDPDLSLHYMKRCVKELLNSDKTHLEISNDLEGNKEYFLDLSDILSSKTMWNFSNIFVRGLTRVNAWDALGFSVTGSILDNILKIETTEENFRNTLIFLSESNIPSNVTSSMLDKIIRAMADCKLRDFCENFKLLMIIYKERMDYEIFLLMIECMNEILLRDYKDISITDATDAIKFFNSLSELPLARRFSNRMNDAFIILNLITKDYTSVMNILKSGSPKVTNVTKYDKAVQKLLEKFEDFFEVQDIIMMYQRYFAFHSMKMHQLGHDVK